MMGNNWLYMAFDPCIYPIWGCPNSTIYQIVTSRNTHSHQEQLASIVYTIRGAIGGLVDLLEGSSARTENGAGQHSLLTALVHNFLCQLWK